MSQEGKADQGRNSPADGARSMGAALEDAPSRPPEPKPASPRAAGGPCPTPFAPASRASRGPRPDAAARTPATRRQRRRQRPKRLAVRRPAPPNLDRHALRQVPEKTQPLRRQGQGGPAPEARQAGVRELVLNLQRAGCCACHRRTCRVVFVQPAFCRKNPCTVRLSKHFNDFLSGIGGNADAYCEQGSGIFLALSSATPTLQMSFLANIQRGINQ